MPSWDRLARPRPELEPRSTPEEAEWEELSPAPAPGLRTFLGRGAVLGGVAGAGRCCWRGPGGGVTHCRGDTAPEMRAATRDLMLGRGLGWRLSAGLVKCPGRAAWARCEQVVVLLLRPRPSSRPAPDTDTGDLDRENIITLQIQTSAAQRGFSAYIRTFLLCDWDCISALL